MTSPERNMAWYFFKKNLATHILVFMRTYVQKKDFSLACPKKSRDQFFFQITGLSETVTYQHFSSDKTGNSFDFFLSHAEK